MTDRYPFIRREPVASVLPHVGDMLLSNQPSNTYLDTFLDKVYGMLSIDDSVPSTQGWSTRRKMRSENTVQPITSESEKKDLLCEMVRFQPDYGVSGIKWMESFTELLITMPTVWYLVNVPLRDEYADFWIRKYGEWKHGSGRTQAHNRLGMAYAWWALHEANGLEEIHLSDSPDFWGTMQLSAEVHGTNTISRVCGDVGKCSPVAMLDGTRALRFHDIWISVTRWDQQVLVQFGYNVAEFQSLKLWGPMGKVQDYSKVTEDIFFCKHCNEWSITDESRRAFIERWQARQNVSA